MDKEFHNQKELIQNKLTAIISNILMSIKDAKSKKEYLIKHESTLLERLLTVSIKKEDFEVSGLVKEILDERKK